MTYLCILGKPNTVRGNMTMTKGVQEEKQRTLFGGHDNLYYIKDSKKKQVDTKESRDLC